MNDETTCVDCENHQRRGDEFSDKYDNLCKDFNRLDSLYDSKCDEYKEALILNGKLRLLLSEKGVEHDL